MDVKFQSNIANIEYIRTKNHNKDSHCHRNKLRLLTNHTLHYDHRRHPSRRTYRLNPENTRMWANANLMVALPNTGGALCSTPQSLADAHY